MEMIMEKNQFMSIIATKAQQKVNTNRFISNRLTMCHDQVFWKGPHYLSQSWFVSHTISMSQTAQLNVNGEEY